MPTTTKLEHEDWIFTFWYHILVIKWQNWDSCFFMCAEFSYFTVPMTICAKQKYSSPISTPPTSTKSKHQPTVSVGLLLRTGQATQLSRKVLTTCLLGRASAICGWPLPAQPPARPWVSKSFGFSIIYVTTWSTVRICPMPISTPVVTTILIPTQHTNMGPGPNVFDLVKDRGFKMRGSKDWWKLSIEIVNKGRWWKQFEIKRVFCFRQAIPSLHHPR